MMFRGRIAAVSYLNTVPFIYGIEHAAELRATLLLSPPNGCAKAYNSGLADIALVPVGALPSLSDTHIITPFCIGATGRVRTVAVMTDQPIDQIRRIWLDTHSITSALLVKILCKHFWEISPEFAQLDDYTLVDDPQEGDAFLLIGDKVFDYEGRFGFTWDLAECWERMSGLPFVFAVWIARGGVPKEDLKNLETALGYGTQHIREAISHYGHSGKAYAYEYLTKNIDYIFDDQKRKAFSLYWELGRKFVPKVEPG